MLNNSDIKISSDVKTKIKINDKGKLLAPLMADQGGDPCEKLTWGTGILNEHLTIFNLKMLPSFDGEKEYIPKIHPSHLQDSSNKMVQEAYYKLNNLRSHHHFTDDSFFTGELIKSALTIFAKNNAHLNCNQHSVLAEKYDENLKQFMKRRYNANLARKECGGRTLAFLYNFSRSGENYSNRNGCAMRIPLVGIFANSLSQLWEIVWVSIRNTHRHVHSFDAARSVASIVFMARGGLGQKNMANYINLAFKPKYTKFVRDNDVNKRAKYFGYVYKNEDHFLDFNMDNCTLQSVYDDRLKYKYTETALDTVVVALRIICVAGSFYEAWALAKSYGGDADTLQTIVCAMAAVVFGVPEEFQKLTKNKLTTYRNDSPEIKNYANVSNKMDNEFSSRYPENIALDVQLKQTLDMIDDIIKNQKKDIDINVIEEELGFSDSKQIDEFSYQREHYYEFFVKDNPKTVLSYFVAIPIVLICMAFYFLPTNAASILLIVVCMVGFIAFHFTSKTCTNSKIKELKNSCPSEDINHDRSNELKNLIKSIIEEWNFNLDQTKEYNLNQREYFGYELDQREYFGYELDGKRPEICEKFYEDYIKNMKLNTSTPGQMYQDYINEEKAFYDKVNAHNKATTEYKTQKKLEKLKSLTLEQLEKINGYVTKINEIAEKYGIEDRIKFDQAEFLEWQKQQIKEQTDNVLQQDKQKQQDNHINENEIFIN